MTSKALHATKPVVLCILDGWGYRDDSENNAIALAPTPNYDRFLEECPRGFLETSGLAVGLPEGQMGNSEVGHMNLGGGRVVMQDLPRIDSCIAEGKLGEVDNLRKLIAALKDSGGTCHLMGLLSPGGVHSHQDHMVALAKECAKAGVPVAIHAFLDGRDVPPKSALGFIEKFEKDIAGLDNVAIATVSGRYYAMDRDKRWDRVKLAYDAMAEAKGEKYDSARTVIGASYNDDKTDEFVLPAVVGDYAGMKDGDGLLMANFRADRAREILTCFVDPHFDGFTRDRLITFAAQTGMVEYSAALNEYMTALFPAEEILDTLGEIVSRSGKTQLRIAETEKYAHVTFFFNGGSEEVYAGEDRILIPSPDVATYDLQPEMSAPEVTDNLVEAITSKKYDLIVVNFANPDMVGHTGVMEAALKAVETIDTSLGRLRDALELAGGTMLVTADHGNIELMKDPVTDQPHTAHTTNLVPFLLVNAPAAAADLPQGEALALENGKLADVAPTVLDLMGLDQPAAMTGHSLLKVVAAGERQGNGLQQQENRATA
ncbi:2,3-bisphosphoglycerate-independent phosphoglycerate mutase [Emcibacter nanhaiensis]|uniref:2,3-bisphosphoglycerate-independent phosphoglycerate mutase n=1 Tax=Emcibacter nanhaiensis TaxID=1505037 RepID=A0A501PN97_9PROT|nr:2,3-bisphosphoglycerate-independent phosphoglycerate mutase [Emcibacter nanhaiensis]TPD61638.1 2,3-bisphosphoglycerate-independent phosphoglycerate mutase [Emcibacter nanhaiensis]